MGTYSTIVNAIRDAATAVNPKGRFTHGRRIDVSQSYDGAYPLINLYPFKTPRDNDDNDTSNILIGFWVQDTPETSMEQREALIDQMDDLSDAFYEDIRDSKIFQLNNFIKEPQYQHYSGTLSGYAVTFNLITKSPC